MGKALQTNKRIVEVVGLVAVVFLFIMMALTVADVFLRTVFNSPILGTTEFTQVLMVCVGYLGLGWCALTGGHVQVDIMVSKYSPRVNAAMDYFNYACVAVTSAILCYATFMQGLHTYRLGTGYDRINLPRYPFNFLISFSFLVLFVALIILVIEHKRQQKAEPSDTSSVADEI